MVEIIERKKKMRILILGSTGMLGNDIYNELSSNYEAIGYGSKDLDITDYEQLKKIDNFHPGIIINCAAYTNVDKAETEKDLCFNVNVKGVENLVKKCKKSGIIFVHISTDYVFDGKNNSYDENDKKNPINHYGYTKSESEDIITHNLKKYYIIRTSWLYGKNGKNFVDTIRKLCNDKKEIKVVNDQFGCPTYTKDLSKAIKNLIEKRKGYGIYHLTNNGSCSWYEFALEIRNITNSTCKIVPCTSEEYKRDAKRPTHSILNNSKTEPLRIWKEALKEYLN